MRTAVLAPLYQRDLDLGTTFVKEFSRFFGTSRNKLHLCFSDQSEVDNFRALDFYNPIICTEKLDVSKKPISQKKIFGVRHIFDNTEVDNVFVVDIDSLPCAYKDLDVMARYNVNRKKIYASPSTNHSIINKVGRDCAQRFFSPQDVEKLEEITKGFTLYFWFNDIPIYERKYFLPFLEYIDYSRTMDRLLYTTFDYIIYVFYLLLQTDWKLVEIDNTVVTDQGSFLETQAMQDPKRFELFFKEASPMWIKEPIHEGAMNRVWMRLHVNR
jgi:hypothetical protein